MKIPFNQYNKSHNSLGHFIFFSKMQFGHVPFNICRNDRASALRIIVNLEHKISYRLLKWRVAKLGSSLCDAKLATAEGICDSLASLQVSSNNCPGSHWIPTLWINCSWNWNKTAAWSWILGRPPANRPRESLQGPCHQWESLPPLQHATWSECMCCASPTLPSRIAFMVFQSNRQPGAVLWVGVCRCVRVYIHAESQNHRITEW